MAATTFAPEIRVVLKWAQGEATRLRSWYVGPEHILLGLARRGEPFLSRGLQVDLGQMRQTVERAVENARESSGLPVGAATDPCLPYTMLAKKVLESAMLQARERSRGSAMVDEGDLLLGLLREGRGIAAQVLTDMGLTHKAVQAKLWVQPRDGVAR